MQDARSIRVISAMQIEFMAANVEQIEMSTSCCASRAAKRRSNFTKSSDFKGRLLTPPPVVNFYLRLLSA
jgi:hypothetical protein